MECSPRQADFEVEELLGCSSYSLIDWGQYENRIAQRAHQCNIHVEDHCRLDMETE